ncbi:MAG: HAMP domain-containing histidine kinase [Sphaerochaetaceae bacterium]|nr:HAMP domain-containing histidine kinase [Sphaerochaetaceae bacterium]
MLKKMRWNMIGIAMAAIFTVMFVLALVINTMSFMAETREADKVLNGIIRYEQELKNSQIPFYMYTGVADPERNYTTRFFTVRFNRSGEVTAMLTDYIVSIDDREAIEYAMDAMDSGKEGGYMGDYRYMVRSSESDTVVAFLNVSSGRQALAYLRSISISIVIAGTALAFLIVFLLSKRAIRPFVQNMEQQKRFITDASHELKTPLTSITASLDVIDMEGNSDEWTDNIRKQTGRMSHLVSELVTLSRLDEFNPELKKETFSLSDTAWEAAESFSGMARGLGKTFNTAIEDDISFTGDRNSINKLLSVLLENAVRYSSENGEINFSLSKVSNGAEIKITNTCSYSSPLDTKHLFDRFYRPDDSRNGETGGTGLGLAIAKSIVQAHNGRISASCEDGTLMTVSVIL